MEQISKQRTDRLGPVVLGFATALLVGLQATGGAADPPDRWLLQENTLFYTDNGTAEFTSSVPLHSFTGRSDHLTGMIDLDENVVDFYLDLSTMGTGLRRRDRDMARTLKIEEFPFAEFTGHLKERFDPTRRDSQTVTTIGEFTIHGVSQPVEIDGILTLDGETLRLQAAWTLRLESYEIEPPGLLFYRVQQEQSVRIRATLRAVGEIP